MKRAIIASVCAASTLMFVACTSSVAGSGSEGESTGHSSEALSGPGCSTVGLSPTGSATTNEGASFSNDTFENCNSSEGVTFTSTASYPGTATCTGIPVFALHIVSPPTDAPDCELTSVQTQVWGMKVVSGQEVWTLITQQAANGTWPGDSGPCVYNAGTGHADFFVTPDTSWAGYSAYRFAAGATETTGLKGTPTTKLYQVTLSAFQYCVY